MVDFDDRKDNSSGNNYMVATYEDESQKYDGAWDGQSVRGEAKQKKSSLKDDIFSFVDGMRREHPGKCLGAIIGMFIGICILIFGFFKTFFVLLCGFIGMFVGFNVDKEGDIKYNIRKVLPDRFRYWR